MLMTFKKILCPTDFSEASRLAIDVAADLAARDKGELCVVHVVEVEPPLPSDPNFVMEVPEYERTLHADAQRQLDGLAACLTNVTIRTMVGHGDPGSEIVRVAQEESSGSHRHAHARQDRVGPPRVRVRGREGGAACPPAGSHDPCASETLRPHATAIEIAGTSERDEVER